MTLQRCQGGSNEQNRPKSWSLWRSLEAGTSAERKLVCSNNWDRAPPPEHSGEQQVDGLPCKAMVFPVVMYGCENWTIKKAKCQRIDAFELWCWRRVLRVPWTARRSNQSILKEISPKYSLEELMLKLKLQYFGHLIGRADSLEKTLMLGEIKGRRRRRQQRMR